MHPTYPLVYLVARPFIEWEEVTSFLSEVGGLEWLDQGTLFNRSGETLTEFMGRLCYRSWKPGLNPNVTKVRTDSQEYFDNLLASRHGSVLEHASYSFVFHNVSRVFTHELVRHRAGVAISQESLRYVRLTDLGFRIPGILSPLQNDIVTLVETLEDFQVKAARQFGLDEPGVPFKVKKEVTSALRRLAPLGLSTTIGWTANIRTIRHVLSMRTEKGAEEEMRHVFQTVGLRMKAEAPMLFEDYSENEEGEWITSNWKV